MWLKIIVEMLSHHFLHKLSSFILANGDTVAEAMKISKLKPSSLAAQKSKAIKIRSLD